MGGLGSPFGSGGGVVPFVSFFVGGGFKGKPKRKAFVVLFYGIPKRNALFFWGGGSPEEKHSSSQHKAGVALQNSRSFFCFWH